MLAQGVSVAMESTHVYWILVYELLESYGIEVGRAIDPNPKNCTKRARQHEVQSDNSAVVGLTFYR